MSEDKTPRPFQPIHPGSILREEMEARGLSTAELARLTGLPEGFLSLLIAGGIGISPGVALALEDALGGGAKFWMRLQEAYELDLTKEAKKYEQSEDETATED